MALINFDTSNQTFRQLLANGLSYHVPRFQRDYSWDTKEWDELWLDLEELTSHDSDSSHYMGFLVLQTDDNRSFKIIDGQQRITTISIIILALLRHMKELGNENLDTDDNDARIKQLHNSYIGDLNPVTLVSAPKLELNRHADDFYKLYLTTLDKIPQTNLNASQRLLRKSFYHFTSKAKEIFGNTENSGRKVAEFIDTLADKLSFTVVKVPDELNAFKVFETLNARGIELSNSDLLKNYIFSVIASRGTHDNELEILETKWTHIVNTLEGKNFSKFLRVYWNSKHDLIRQKDVYKTIRLSIKNDVEQAFNLLNELDHAAEVYGALLDPNNQLWKGHKKAQRALTNLNAFGIRQPLMMLMACYDNFFEAKPSDFIRILENVVTASFRYNIVSNLQTGTQELAYNRIAKSISEGTIINIKDISAKLKEIDPSDASFKESFASQELRTTNNKKIVKYILFTIENHLTNQALDYNDPDYSLEHILPEHPSEAWNHIPNSKQDRMLYRLGNMTLLDTKVNRTLGNAGYSEKRTAYSHSQLKITEDIAETYENWDEDSINDRQRKLANIACEIWQLDSPA